MSWAAMACGGVKMMLEADKQFKLAAATQTPRFEPCGHCGEVPKPLQREPMCRSCGYPLKERNP